MIPLLAPHHAVLRLNTRLYLNCLDGVDDATAARRAGPGTNGMGFLALHLLDAGMELTQLVEHDSVPWEALPGQMERLELGEWRLRDRPERLPHTYTLQAVKRA